MASAVFLNKKRLFNDYSAFNYFCCCHDTGIFSLIFSQKVGSAKAVFMLPPPPPQKNLHLYVLLFHNLPCVYPKSEILLNRFCIVHSGVIREKWTFRLGFYELFDVLGVIHILRVTILALFWPPPPSHFRVTWDVFHVCVFKEFLCSGL